MKKTILFSGSIVCAVFLVGGALRSSFPKPGKTEYQFVEITRGKLENTITSSGTLNPVTTVAVGTQVSGTIAEVYVDYNDRVQKDQLLAKLDTALLKTSVLEARAGVERAKAELEEALSDHDRHHILFQQGFISESKFFSLQSNMKTKKAALQSARASLEHAEHSLNYAFVRSPIHGTVIARNVEAGQTVAASLATPTLFQIAEDLSRMEILADVDESDIGLVKAGQKVRFDVQAYPDKIFEGLVKKIRLQPTMISNVVNYTVVVEAANDEHLLLPGMTATVEFIIEQKEDVFLVPKAALRFQPPKKMLAEFRERIRKEQGTEQMDPPPSDKAPENAGQLWHVDEIGNLAVKPVKIGTSDGTNTEIVKSRHLSEGMQVISGLVHSEKPERKGKQKKNQMFQGGQSGGGPPSGP